MNILLIYLSGASKRNDPYLNLVPTGLCSLHACLRQAGYNSFLANFSGWNVAEYSEELARLRPDMIGISQWTHNRHASMELAGICRQLCPESLILMGGAHATFCHEEILSDTSPVDAVICGEGENTLLELAGRRLNKEDWRDIDGIAFKHEGTIVRTARRAPLTDLDALPFPSRYLDYSLGVDLDLQPEFIVSARGCPSACHFCSSPAFWGNRLRFRSAQSIIEEILYVKNEYGLIYFSIRDDTFTADRRRALAFCSALVEQQAGVLWNCQSRVTALDEELLIMMKKAGCECIQLGIESGSTQMLRQLNKKIAPAQIEHTCGLIRKIGINLSIYLISDIPGENDDDIRLTSELIRRINPDDGYVSPLVYYPGTQLYSEAVMSGRVGRDLFQASRDEALYVARVSGKKTDYLLGKLKKCRPRNAEDFKKQKKYIGFCFTTNVLAGEWFRQRGDYISAEKEFREITVHQQDNPWGWFLLGELYSETGRTAQAEKCFGRVVDLVPRHHPSNAALSQ